MKRYVGNWAGNAAPSDYVWNQEFNGKRGSHPDRAQWAYELGDGSDRQLSGWGNNELEYYTDENAVLDGRGHLVISAVRLPTSTTLNCYYGPCQYTSSRLTTKGLRNFRYGRIEARMRMPEGAGTWPAFWALGRNLDSVLWPNSGEIDIAEGLGRTPYTVYGTIHGPEYFGADGLSATFEAKAPLSEGFHVYGLEWSPGLLRWTFDGAVYHEESKARLIGRTWVFDQPFFLMLNLAVGGGLGGTPASDLHSPATFSIDWIRVSKLAGVGATTQP
jgi:beta-glucanase (GH16 family)